VSFGATILDPACSGSQVLTTTLPGGHAVLLHTIALKPGLLCGDPEVQWSGSAAALHASVVGQHGSVASRSASPRPAAKSAADADEKFTQSLA